jgi:hypothetical protein
MVQWVFMQVASLSFLIILHSSLKIILDLTLTTCKFLNSNCIVKQPENQQQHNTDFKNMQSNEESRLYIIIFQSIRRSCITNVII